MLTRKQHDLLMFIHDRLHQDGVSPSFDEMKEALNLKSKSGIHRLITSLEERGFVRRLPHRARALEVIRLPENTDREQLPIRNRKVETLRRQEIGGHSQPPEVANAAVQLQLYGRIAAGTPIEALRDPSMTVEVPAALLGKGDHYALEVDGDSMINAGIMDGDTVIIERTETADSGDIVVALVEREEVTLKTLHKKGKSVELEPANPKYKTRIYGPDQIDVQGRLVGLLRKY
ncbi:transcriptional repressor LexA [Aestuariispira ectoiniformans]|uniref:transcriptional repressor LexA n=1 Tax=Aestuariispira ectoiniformans TaxID=2775080 RepID=UPI00223BE4BB|nr:transcriptional repressor LexA [Aestuariispira ectoiniformans]